MEGSLVKAFFDRLEDLLPGDEPLSSLVGGQELTDDQVLASVYLRGDRWIRLFLFGHLLLALLLAPVFNTWVVTAIVAPSAFLLLWVPLKLMPGAYLTRCAAGLALQVFVGLHVYQMHGMGEMHFLFFTGLTMMIIYADWRCLWPAAVFIAVQQTAFGLLGNQGIQLNFFENEHVGLRKLAMHGASVTAQLVIVGFWAWLSRRHMLS